MASNDSNNRYNQRGVSSSKDEVHQVVDKLDRGCFPGAFCKVTNDFLTGHNDRCNVIHSDGAGTKSILAYLWYKETGDPNVFRGIAQDSIVMNLDDLACVGIWDQVVLSSTVNRNARNFPAEALAALIEGTEEFIQTLQDFGIKISSGGGETADVGDLTGTVAVDSCAVAIVPKEKIIDNSNISEGLSIVGLSSSGQASYENKENSGIGSNGLTSARHELLSSYYRENFPETFDPKTKEEFLYCGPFRMQDSLIGSSLLVGEALLSPTRTYLPVIKSIMSEKGNSISGLVHCSGGGQTKCMRFGTNVHHIKDNLFSPPPLFQEIQRVSGTTDKEMHQVYNMGHRFEIYCKAEAVEEIIGISKSYNIEAQVIGRTEKSNKENSQNHLTIKTDKFQLTYG
ncbi:AIR synthase-related protein [Opitutales bacterium]|nr:AIR synthase-related protein [Opitutales bacterium]